MTNPSNDQRGTIFDLPFETARERIASLRSTASSGSGSRPDTARSAQPVARRLRSALGSRLIEVGSALVADDPTRRSATRT